MVASEGVRINPALSQSAYHLMRTGSVMEEALRVEEDHQMEEDHQVEEVLPVEEDYQYRGFQEEEDHQVVVN